MNEGIVDRKDILPLLGAVKKQGDWIMAFCPAHADGQKHGMKSGHSLGLSNAGVLKCYAGCSFADVMAALRKNGPQASRSAQEPPKQAGDGLSWRQVAVFAYHANGKHIAEHVRLEAIDPSHPKGKRKRFVWRISDTDRRTLRDTGIDETDLPLYALECLEGLPLSEWVNFVEGESVCTALSVRNQPAVCLGGGASQKAFGNALVPLKGRRVRIWPDNDPPGFEYAENMRRAIVAAGAAKVVIMPPVGGAGDDLVNYFEGGGDWDTLIAGSLLEDAIEYIEDDHFRIRLCTEGGEVSFDVADVMQPNARDLQCSLTVEWHSMLAADPYWQHINWLSPSARESLGRVLGKHFAELKINWTATLNRALALLRASLAQADISEAEEPPEDMAPAQWVVEGLIPEGGGSILFAQPKKGKSQFALALAAVVNSGTRVDWMRAPRARPVLYINLERSKESMQARLGRVNAAVGLPARTPLRFIHKRGHGLSAILPSVRAVIRKHGIELVILDSISRGGFGDLTHNEVNNAAIDGLNRLGVSWLAIGHSPRSEGDDTPHLFGGIMQDAGADAMVALKSKPGDNGKLLVTLEVTAANDFAKPPPLDLVYEFDSVGLTGIRRPNDYEAIDLESVKILTVKQQIIGSLRDEGPCSVTELCKRLGKQRQNISRDINALSRDGFVRKDGEIWELTYQAYQPQNGDAHHDTETGKGGVSSGGENPPKGGSPSVIHPPSGPSTPCGKCGREGSVEGYDDTGRELCPSCFDEWKETGS